MPINRSPEFPDTPDATGSGTVPQHGRPPSLLGNSSPDADSVPTRGADTSGTGRYELIEEIARGGMGIVWRGHDLILNREVGVKTLLKAPAEGNVLASRFRAEAHITGQLQHPNIPPVHDLGTLPDGRPFLAMKLIKGRTLEALLQERPDPAHDRGRFIAIFEQIAHGVAYAHAHNVIHRDLKPLNVMVGAFGEVQVMDWGLAKVLTTQTRSTTSDGIAVPTRALATSELETAAETEIRAVGTDAEGTRFGSVLGTPAYMPREQAIGAVDQIDTRSDVFSLGGMLCAILTGKPPYISGNAETTRQLAAVAKLENAFVRLDACGAEPGLIALAKRCLSAEREDRPKDAGVVAKAIAALRAEAEMRARQAETEAAEALVREAEQRKRRRVQLALVAAVVGLVVVGGAGAALAVLRQRAVDARDNEMLARADADIARGVAESERGEAVKARDDAKEARDNEEDARKAAEKERRIAEKARDSEKALREKLEVIECGRTVQVAHQEWRDNNIAGARALLEDIKPHLRGWEWHYVHRLCNGSLLTLRHTNEVYSATFSNNESRIVTASGDQTAKVWDASTGTELFSLKGHNGRVYSAQFNQDDTRIVTASDDGTAKVWDAKTGALLLTLKGHRDGVFSASFNKDGSRVVTRSCDFTAKVWDAKNGASLFTLNHTNTVMSVQFSADDSLILTAGDETAKVWDAKTGAELHTLKGHTHTVYSASFNGTGSRIVTGSMDKTAKVWDAKTGKEVLTLKGHTSLVVAAMFSADDSLIVTGSADTTAIVWDAKTGEVLSHLKGHTEGLRDVAFSADNTRIATAGGDNQTIIWDAKTGAALLTLKGHTDGVCSASFNKDGSRSVTASKDKTARVWDTKKDTECLTLSGHSGYVNSVLMSADGSRIVSRCGHGLLNVWNTKTATAVITTHQNGPDPYSIFARLKNDEWRLLTTTGKILDAKTGAEICTLKQGQLEVLGNPVFSADGSRLVTTHDEITAKVWDAETGVELFTLQDNKKRIGNARAVFSEDGMKIVTWDGQNKTADVWDAKTGANLLTLNGHTGGVTSAAFSPDGSRIVTSSNDKTAKVWDAKTGDSVLTLGLTRPVFSASFSQDNTRIITLLHGGGQQIWDAKTGVEVLPPLQFGYYSVSFSSDNKLIVTTSQDNMARVWDAQTGAELNRLKGHTANLTSAAFSTDSLRIVTTSSDRTIKIWDTKTGAELITLKGHTAIVLDAAFSADGSKIVSGGQDNKVMVWDASPLDHEFLRKAVAPPPREKE